MKMRQEICEKCKHCLSCMCGDEFEDCYIKNPNLKRTITTIVMATRNEYIEHWADIIRTVLAAEVSIEKRDAWVQRLREARNLPEDQRMKVFDDYVMALATEIVSQTTDEELEEL